MDLDAAHVEELRSGLLADAVRALEAALPDRTPARAGAGRSTWDVLVDGLDVRDVRVALRGLNGGAGGELVPSRHGNVPFCSAESSALMAVNFLAPFVSRGVFCDLPSGTLEFEREFRIEGVRSPVGPTLDAVYESGAGCVLVEAKTAEPWRSAPKASLSRQYDPIAAQVSPNTLAAIQDLRDGKVAYRCLDAAQLVKHLLAASDAARRQLLRGPVRLVLLYWRPKVTGRYEPLFSMLERELDDFAARLSDQPIKVSGISTASLLDRWAAGDGPDWLRGHTANLHLRHSVRLDDHSDG